MALKKCLREKRVEPTTPLLLSPSKLLAAYKSQLSVIGGGETAECEACKQCTPQCV